MMGIGSITWRDRILVGLLALICYLPFLSAAPLFDWDEINFAESAREMIVSGNYFQVQINFEPFWEKPPLFIWMQVLSMKAFGINEFAARFPNAIVGMFSLLAFLQIGARLRGKQFGWMLVGLYLASFLPFLYFKSGIIDPSFNLLIFLGLERIIRQEQGEGNGGNSVWAGIWIGLATLTKGPVALLVTGLVYFFYKLVFERKHIPWLAGFKFFATYLLVILSWFGSIILLTEGGMETVQKFIIYQAELFSQAVAGHEQPFFYHFLVFILGCFPLSAFVFRGMGKLELPKEEKIFKDFMKVWFWVVLILFSIVRTKIVHYSSMLYFPGVFLAAYYLDAVLDGKKSLRWDNWLILGLGFLVLGVGSVGLNWAGGNLEKFAGPHASGFMKAAIELQVEWTGFEFLPGLVFLSGFGLAIWWLLKGKSKQFLLTGVVTMALFINLLNWLVLPRVADYSQNTAIRFFEEKAHEDAYVMVEGYKSYAQYFYGEVKPFPHPEMPKEKRGDWMARGPVDKDVYLVTRIDRATEEFEKVWFAKFQRIFEGGGFVFYKREMEARP